MYTITLFFESGTYINNAKQAQGVHEMLQHYTQQNLLNPSNKQEKRNKQENKQATGGKNRKQKGT
jgi:hypothetical protein